ncbi:helix-turn-helix transcriptional regulator [Streptomyces sp. NPDC002564]|uniref:helix-turn-helix transcriptional regulator n=1 Tax=Streptomyces sp. NPDC002564 TaxID=3364649 RepID=UPI0036B97981
MSRPTGRVLTLLELLQSGGIRTVAELADRLGVEGRTVRRYVEQLIDLDVPVESVRGRHGGYRLGSGYRLPPLMLGEEEALAVLLGLAAVRRAGPVTGLPTAGETAAAKIRRVLPRHLAHRLDALLETVAHTGEPRELPAPDADTLLTVADAVRHGRPVSIGYTDREGRRSRRVLHAYGIVAHAGRWYVTGAEPVTGEERTFRLDRVTEARTLPGSFEAPVGRSPRDRVLAGFATAGYRHEVTLRIRATARHLRAHLPAAVAVLHEEAGESEEEAAVAVEAEGADATGEAGGERWWRAEVRAERLDWLPPVLAALDRPFVVERPDELRRLIGELADRLASRARRTPSA